MRTALFNKAVEIGLFKITPNKVYDWCSSKILCKAQLNKSLCNHNGLS